MDTQKPSTILWTLVAVSALSSVLAVSALVTAIVTSSHRITASQYKIGQLQYALQVAKVSRQQAAEDSCKLLRGMVNLAAGPTPMRQAQASQFLLATGLADCKQYAISVTTVHVPVTPPPHDQPDPHAPQ